MAYRCAVGGSAHLYFESKGAQTEAILLSDPPGKQQSMTSMKTGAWKSPPSACRKDDELFVQLRGEHGDFLIRAHGGSLGMTSGEAPAGEVVELETVEAMPEVAPLLDMGDMDVTDFRARMKSMGGRTSREMRFDWDPPSQGT